MPGMLTDSDDASDSSDIPCLVLSDGPGYSSDNDETSDRPGIASKLEGGGNERSRGRKRKKKTIYLHLHPKKTPI